MLRHFGQEFNVAEIPIVVADVIDLASLVSMCSRTRVLINCVGPVRPSLHAAGAAHTGAAHPMPGRLGRAWRRYSSACTASPS